MKKFLLGIAVFITTAILCVISAGAEVYKDYEYEVLSDGTVEITSYSGSALNLRTPAEIDGKKVTSIAPFAFAANKFLESVTIPDGVTSIGESAFITCSNLEVINLPSTLERIDDVVFFGCYKLEKFKIPASLKSFGDGNFVGCEKLRSITVDSNNKYFCSEDGILFSKDKTTLIAYPACKNDTYMYEVPQTVTELGSYAFYGNPFLNYITLPDSITEIPEGAFSGCSIYDIEIPKKCTKIGILAFEYCPYLYSVNIPDSVTDIEDQAFFNCQSLSNVNISASVTSIGSDVFYGCRLLNQITVDENNEYYCSVNGILFNKDKTTLIAYPVGKMAEKFIVPDGVKKIDSSAFACGENLKTVVLPDSLTHIGNGAFYYCIYLRTAVLPQNLESIGYDAFGYTNIATLTIPKTVTEIGSYAFFHCTKLTSVTIPENITGIKDGVFGSCTSLKSVTFHNKLKYINDIAFIDCPLLTTVTIPESVTYVGLGAFGYAEDFSTGAIYKLEDFTIKCYKGSAAEKYAIDNELQYTVIPSEIKNFSLIGRSSNSFQLFWTKNASADGYIIEMYKDGKWIRIARIAGNSTNSYRVTGLAAGTAYKFRMKAYKMDGTTALYSKYTSTLAARTNPSNVTGLKLGGRASNALRLNWTKNISADGYIVEQYKSGKWVRIARIAGNTTTTYRIAGLTPSTEYKFRVKAYKMSGSTALYSSYTNLSAYTKPSNVADLKITGKATTALRLGWSKNASADGYIVEMYSGGKWVRVAKITSNTTVTYRKAGLKKDTTYKFRVRTYNMVGSTALYGGYVNVSGKTNS